MNEWKKLLEQTHPKFQPLHEMANILEDQDAALAADATPEAYPSSLSVEITPASLEIESQMAADVEETDSAESAAEAIIDEIEWISPTQKLQQKIKDIPDKFGFKIGEAADYVGVKQHVLRYWESEFPQFKPKKSKNGQRMYTKRDVELALMIRKLLHDDRFSIEGAQTALKKLRQQVRDKDKVAPEAQSKPLMSSVDGGVSVQSLERLVQKIREARTNLAL